MMRVILCLSDSDGFREVRIGELGIDDNVAMFPQVCRLDPTGDGSPSMKKEDCRHASSPSLSISGGEFNAAMQQSRASFSFRAAESLLFSE